MKKQTSRQIRNKAKSQAKLSGLTGDKLRSYLRSIYSSLLRKAGL